MSYMGLQYADDRRLASRVRVEMFFNQYIRDEPYRSLAVNVSANGMAAHRLVEKTSRHARVVGIEFELPGTGEVIWASAETEFEAIDQHFHRAGIRFLSMARRHERLLREFVRERQRWLNAGWRHGLSMPPLPA
jgi:c-di-GMP-binding flagellar brake protein YcgR